ncbi:transcriptional regulator [Streptomyces goshikiensis]|uniref:transcriptional regulator n=1 Tax=Streptomyces goshikiensis TaxID=1942 RepID=UPI00369982F1
MNREEQHPLAALLQANGWTAVSYLRRVAARHKALGYGAISEDKKRIYRWIHRSVVPEWTAQLAMADLHGIPVETLHELPWPLWLASAGHDDGQILNPAWTPAATNLILTSMAGGPMDRRSFLIVSTLSAVTAQWATASPASAAETGSRAGLQLVALHDERLAALRRLDDQVGSGEVYQAARAELRIVTRTLTRCSYSEEVGRRLYAAAAEASRICGWTAYDSGYHATAERHYVTALRAAASANDQIVGANTLSFWAIQRYSTGDPQGAQHLVETALGAASSIGSPRMTAMLHARSARAFAWAADRRSSQRAVGAAFDAYDRITGSSAEPDCTYWVNRGELHQLAGSSALNLAHPAEALNHFRAAGAAQSTDAYDETAFPRGAAIYLSREAEAALALGDVDAALHSAHQAVERMGGVTSARGTSTLNSLRNQLSARRTIPAVRDFLAATT